MFMAENLYPNNEPLAPAPTAAAAPPQQTLTPPHYEPPDSVCTTTGAGAVAW